MMIYRHILNALVLAFVTAISVPAQAKNPYQDSEGVTLTNTRVIYTGSARNGITYTLENNTPRLYLLQSRVLRYGESTSEDESPHAKKVPFIVLPPLTRFEPGNAITLRIRQTQNSLPQDRESIFLLALNAIPAQKDSNTQLPLLQMSTQNNLKLFYRPGALPPMDEAKVTEQLRFWRRGNMLTVLNSAPFYVTFSSLYVGKTAIDQKNTRMVAPFSEQSWPLPASSRGDVRWQLLTDQGRPGKMVTRPAG